MSAAANTPVISKDAVDFENFQVPPERAELIRQSLEALKSSHLIADLLLVTSELGEDKNPSLPGLASDIEARIFVGPSGTPLEMLTLVSQGTEFKIFWSGSPLIEVLVLPKGGEFALVYLDEARWAELQAKPDFDTQLRDLCRDAKSKKSARAQAFREKLGS